MTDQKSFTGIDLSTDNPPGVCRECAVHGVKHVSGIVYAHCEHNQSGAVRQPAEDWVVFAGTSAQQFKQDMLSTILIFEVACGEVVADQIAADGMTMQ